MKPTDSHPTPPSPRGRRHTPTPWTFIDDGQQVPAIDAEYLMDGCICVMNMHDPENEGNGNRELARAKANAAFIVEACNAHEGNLAKLATYEALIDQVSRYLTGDCRAGALSDLEGIICDVEGVRADHGLDKEQAHSAALPQVVEALEAIQARVNGEWDNPALVKQGALSTDTAADCERFAAAALAQYSAAQGKPSTQ